MAQDDSTYVCNFFGAPHQHSSLKAYSNPPHASGQSRKAFVGTIHFLLFIWKNKVRNRMWWVEPW